MLGCLRALPPSPSTVSPLGVPVTGFQLVHEGGEFLGGDNFCGENLAVKKSGEISPPAKFSRCVANNVAVNSDVPDYCEFRHVQRCASLREGTKMSLFPSGAHQEIS